MRKTTFNVITTRSIASLGIITPSGFRGKIYVRKDDLPGSIRLGLKENMRMIPIERLEAGWEEVCSWSSCKLFARKFGAVVRYAHQHYGYYDCCKIAAMQVQGYDWYGIGTSTMPIWALSNLQATFDSIYGRTERKRMRVLSWTRYALESMTCVIEYTKSNGATYRWNLHLERENFNQPSTSPWIMLMSPESDRLNYLSNGWSASAVRSRGI